MIILCYEIYHTPLHVECINAAAIVAIPVGSIFDAISTIDLAQFTPLPLEHELTAVEIPVTSIFVKSNELTLNSNYLLKDEAT